MTFRLAVPPGAGEKFRRHGVVAILASVAIVGFVALAALAASERRNDEARTTQAAVANATDAARAILDRQQRGLDALARVAATASDTEARRALEGAAALAPGIRGASLADPAGTVELSSAEGPDEDVFSALAADAVKQAAANPAATMLVTQTLHDGDTAIVGLARPWRNAGGEPGGIAIVAIDATAFPALDITRGDSSPLFASRVPAGVEQASLAPYPLILDYARPKAEFGAWPFATAAGITVAALLALLTVLLRRLAGTECAIARQAQVERHLREGLAAAAADATRIDELSRTKSQFFAQVTHELRTPLNAIIGFSETIRREIFGPVANTRYLEYVGLIHDAGEHLLSLINDLLDEARIEAGKMEVAPIRVAAPALARSALDLVEMLAEAREIAITTTGLSSCPDLNIDPRSMKQVLVNLLSNAIKYTPPGGRIDICFARDDAGGVAIEVADTGIGMSAADLSVAFEPFGRAGDVEARRQQGTGLGLSLARALVRLHGGDLTLTSELDHGTTATVTLPPSAVFAPAAASVPAKAA